MSVLIVLSLSLSLGCKKNDDSKKYLVVFESNGGSDVADQSVKDGSKLTKPANPVKADFVFNGWYEDVSLQTKWDFDNGIVTGDMFLYAGWIEDGYVIKFETNGGSLIPDQIVGKDGGKATQPGETYKTNSIFAGWYKDADLKTLWDFNETVTGDMTLYAGWYVGGNYNIVTFGAVPDGKTLNTRAIQAAIDRCSTDGGGQVIVPRGVFITGTVFLKDGVTLHLEKNAVLKGSPNPKDYAPSNIIKATRARNIGITGQGVIDGNGYTWYSNTSVTYHGEYSGPLITFDDCHIIHIENVWLQYSASWTLVLRGCSKIAIRGVTIRNPLHATNSDGIDIVASSDIIISDCDIYGQDDAIVLKHDAQEYANKTCENITVTNCILTSRYSCFKIGTETVYGFRNIVFSNSTIRSAKATDSLAHVAALGAPLKPVSGISINTADGSTIDGLTITNISMDAVRNPIFLRLCGRLRNNNLSPKQPGALRNVIISNITVGSAEWPVMITGIYDGARYWNIENVTLSNLNIGFTGGVTNTEYPEIVVPEDPTGAPDALTWFYSSLPNTIVCYPACGFFVRHVRGLDLQNIRIRMEANDIRPAMIFDDVKDLNVNNFRVDKLTGHSAIRLTGVDDAIFRDLSLPGTTQYDFCLRGTNNRLEYQSARVHNH